MDSYLYRILHIDSCLVSNIVNYLILFSLPPFFLRFSVPRLNTTWYRRCSRAWDDHMFATPTGLHTYPHDDTMLEGQMACYHFPLIPLGPIHALQDWCSFPHQSVSFLPTTCDVQLSGCNTILDSTDWQAGGLVNQQQVFSGEHCLPITSFYISRLAWALWGS
jgi:hypothetical protein